MKSKTIDPNDPNVLRTLKTLNMLRRSIDTEAIDQEARDLILKWLRIGGEHPKKLELETIPLGNVGMLGILRPETFDGLAVQLIPVTMAIQSFDLAISEGLPGAEALAEDFLRDCGFDDDAVRRILLDMVSRSPEPEPGALN